MKLAALILAKSKSKRLPNKNTLPFHGKPLYLHNVGKCLDIFDAVYVSSDDAEILDDAEACGAIPIIRPEYLCGDTPNIPVYAHAMTTMKCDAFVAVQANSPCIPKNTISFIKKLLKMGVGEIMTCDAEYGLYGSAWAMTRERLATYGDPYIPTPDILVRDTSIDIHTQEDFNQALHEH